MTHRALYPLVAVAMISALGAANAQLPKLPGGAGGAVGLPDVSSMGAGNAAGVLGYCVKNKLVGGADASSVLGGLTAKPEVKASPDFKSGEVGNILSGDGSSFSLNSAPKQMKSKACDMVLKQGKS
ncbi:MAG: DUF2501 domain-containing protein, partial [Novosphingobium sp.]